MTTNKKIAKAFSVLTIASVIGHGLSLVKEMLVANSFGISKAMDSFNLALTVPVFMTSVLFSPFTTVFIPNYIKERVRDLEEANKIASIISNYLMIILIVLTIIVLLFSRQIVQVLFDIKDYKQFELTLNIVRILCITMVFTGLIKIQNEILNALEEFMWPALSQVIITVILIVSVITLSKIYGIYVLVWGTFLGLLIQFVFLYFVTSKRDFRYSFSFNYKHPKVIGMFHNFIAFFVLGIVSALVPVVNRIMASWLPEGSVAALSYADRLVQVPMIIFSGSIAVAIYPYLAQQVAENRTIELKDTLSKSIKLTGFIFIPMAIIMMILAKPIIQVMFQRGAFNENASHITSIVFQCYLLQLFSVYATAILMRLSFVFQDYIGIFKIVVVNLILTIILNLLLIKYINPQIAGIALSNSIISAITACLYFILIKSKIQYLYGISILFFLLKTLFIAIIMGVQVFLTSFMINTYFPSNMLVNITICAFSGFIFYVVLARLLKLEEVDKIKELIASKILNSTKRTYGQ